MYILKQLFFSISVNSGFGNIYLAALAARQIFCHYSPRFQRIIVNYRMPRGHKHISLVFSGAFRDIFSQSFLRIRL